jgi:hypothetical protein
VIAFSSIVSENMVAIYDFIEGVSFYPGLLYKVYVEALSFHHANAVFVECVVIRLSGHQFTNGVTG